MGDVHPQFAHTGIGSWILPRKAPSLAVAFVVAVLVITAETLVLYPLKQVVPVDLLSMVYLLGVMAVSVVWGFGLTLATAAASVLVFDYFHTPPFHEISLNTPEDHAALGAFLVVGLLTSALARLARSRAAVADRAGERARELAEQQAALRRVATLVARGASPSEVFSAVAEEMGRCLNVAGAAVSRFDGDAIVLVGIAPLPSEFMAMVRFGELFPLDGDNVYTRVLRTGVPARTDTLEKATGAIAEHLRALGIQSMVGVPIIVGDRVWGTATAGSIGPHPPAPDTEARLADFADLVATAIANAATRDELIASRARIVAAADDARRRIERDLHDGAQQRLVALGLQARLAEVSVPLELPSLREQLAHIGSGLTAVSSDLQQISRGIHPAILSEGGLGPALKTLARRCPVPVNVDVGIERRLPEPVEVAAYYVVAEALTNAAKYAQASEVIVSAETKGASLHLSIQDDGMGGADTRRGSGLIGLKDRVEALGGHIEIVSPPGSGTSLHITIPVEP